MASQFPLYNQTVYTKDELCADVTTKLDPVGLTTVLAAYDMATSVHEYQVRTDATPYFWHISRVAKVVVQELEYYNADVIAASLLHDVLEDSEIITAEVIKYNFNSYISYIVEVLTKNFRLMGVLREQEDQEYIERINFASVDCKIVKFAERLDNFRCLEFGVKRNPFRYIEETEMYYFPMAMKEKNDLLNALMQKMNEVKGKLLA